MLGEGDGSTQHHCDDPNARHSTRGVETLARLRARPSGSTGRCDRFGDSVADVGKALRSSSVRAGSVELDSSGRYGRR